MSGLHSRHSPNARFMCAPPWLDGPYPLQSAHAAQDAQRDAVMMHMLKTKRGSGILGFVPHGRSDRRLPSSVATLGTMAVRSLARNQRRFVPAKDPVEVLGSTMFLGTDVSEIDPSPVLNSPSMATLRVCKSCQGGARPASANS